jgi:glycosyltransferase involved in cell wall biosynthesis
MANIAHMVIEDLLEKGNFDISLITYKENSIPKNPAIKIYAILKKESINSLIKTSRILRKEKFDIIHILSTRFMHGRLFLFISFLIKLLRIKSKIVISAHEFYDFSTLRQLIVGGIYHLFLLRYSDLILVFNKTYPKMILSKWYYKKNKDQIIFISKNVQSMRYDQIIPSEKWNKKNLKPFILFFGFLRYGKGLPFLVIALKKIKKKFPDIKLIIAGGIGIGPGTQDYYLTVKNIVNKLDLKEDVIFTNFIPKEEVIELFNLAELVVYPYLSIENSGALFIALYTQKLIITSDVPGFRNILTHGKDGLLVKPKNSAAIANAVINILQNKELMKKLEMGAKETYEINSFNKLINRYLEIFRNL